MKRIKWLALMLVAVINIFINCKIIYCYNIEKVV